MSNFQEKKKLWSLTVIVNVPFLLLLIHIIDYLGDDKVHIEPGQSEANDEYVEREIS